MFLSGWVDVPWVQSASAPSQKSNNHETSTVKVVDISSPDVRATMSDADKKDSKESKDSKTSAFKVRGCRGFRDNIGRRLRNNASDVGELENQSNLLRDSGREISADLANLRLLMAVEDLLDNASSDLVASALAEAASLDQLRAASRNLQTSFRQSTSTEKKSSPASDSQESSSPPAVLTAAETETKVNVHHETQTVSTADRNSSLSQSEKTLHVDDDSESKLENKSKNNELTSGMSSLSRGAKVMRSELSVYVDSKSSVHMVDSTETKDAEKSSFDDSKNDDTSRMNEEAANKEEKSGHGVDACEKNVESAATEAEDLVDKSTRSPVDKEFDETSGESGETEVEYSEEREPKEKKVASNDSSQAGTEDKGGFFTEFFDTRSDEISESDKNRQNEIGRGLLSSEGDLLFNKNTEVRFGVYLIILHFDW